MTTSSIDLLSVIPGLQIGASDVLQAENMLTQTLAASDPSLDLRTGTAIRDLSIRPSATLLATINKALIYYWTQNSLANVDNTTPTTFVDQIMSNYFMTRFSGSNAVISANLYFAKPVSVALTTDIFFSVDNINLFYPSSAVSYSASQMTFDTSTNQYYLTVSLTAAATGTQYNISAGSLIYFSNFNPYFLHAEIQYLTSVAKSAETNTQFISRAQNSISTRNLINTPSITDNILSNFSVVTQVYSVGMGDAPMVRDKVQVVPPILGNPIWIHLGGMTDIYLNVPQITSLVQFTTDLSGNILLTGAIYNISISSLPGGPNIDTIPNTTPFRLTNSYSASITPTSIIRSGTVVSVTDPNHGMSVGERISISGANQTQYNGTFQIASVVSKDLYTFNISSTPATPATGTLVVQKIIRTYDVGFSARQSVVANFSGPIIPISPSGVVWVIGGTVTVSCSQAHGFSIGQVVTLTGLSSYDGIWTIYSVPTSTTFTFLNANNFNPVTTTSATAQVINGNQSVSLNLNYFQDIDGIQTYLQAPANRVLSSDQLARGFNLSFLSFTITGYGATAPDQALCTTTITKYLVGLSPGQDFILSDLVSMLNTAGITTLQTPLSVTYTKYWRDLFGPTYGVITDALNPNDPTNLFVLGTVTTLVATL